MSIKLTAKAWETNQSGNDLLVLLALCDFSSDEGISYPSLKTLSDKAKVSKTTLSYILRAYEEIGVITREQRQRENKSDTSTLYKINHLNIDVEAYKIAYQKARKYTSKNNDSSHCEHPKNIENVNTGNEIVNTLNANCEHLEPSVLNHQDINQEEKKIKKENSNPKNDLIDELLEEDFQYFNQFKTIIEDFIQYRKKIKKALKTTGPIKAFIQALWDLQDLGYSIDFCIEQMKANEWQTIKPDYIHKPQKVQNNISSKQEKTKAFLENYYKRKAEANQNNNADILDAEVV
ncbi:hypothetical protein CRU92_10795 [Arcobacter sp. FW59]|nr:hypothetical protein CRU92_10795 [Arcobacter sp. FW59]